MKHKTKLLIAISIAFMMSMTSCELWWDLFGPDHGPGGPGRPPMEQPGHGHGGGRR